MDAALASPRLDSAEMNDLAGRATDDLEARERLTAHCMGLIAWMAGKFSRQLGEDAFGEASVAFLEAIDDYDTELSDFRSWAVGKMWLRLMWMARRESVHRARFLLSEPIPQDGAGLPNLIRRAWCAGDITERQVRVLLSNIDGQIAKEAAGELGISRAMYYYDLADAIKALKIHAE